MYGAAAIEGLARSSLADVDLLGQACVEACFSIAPYSNGVVPIEVLRPDTQGSFELILRLIGDLPVPTRLEDICERVGRHRAQVGLPLDVFLGVIPTDFEIVWENLRRHADAKADASLAQNAGRVWQSLERYAVDIERAYRVEAVELSRSRNAERDDLIAAFLSSGGQEPFLSQVVTALGMRRDAEFVVAAVPPRSESALHHAVDELRSRGVKLHVQTKGPRSLFFAQLPTGGPWPSLAWLRDVPCAIGPTAVGLADVPRVATICDQILQTLSPRASAD